MRVAVSGAEDGSVRTAWIWVENGFGGFVPGTSRMVVMMQTRGANTISAGKRCWVALLAFPVFLGGKKALIELGLLKVLYRADAVSSLCSARPSSSIHRRRHRCHLWFCLS